MTEATAALISYGGLGILALISILANMAQWRRGTQIADRYTDLLAANAKADADLAHALAGLTDIIKDRRP